MTSTAALPAAALAERWQQREAIQRLDNLGLRQVRHIFTNGHETARRLKFYNGFDAEVLHPPVFASGHYCGSQDYFLLPGRLHRWKRVDLALRAMQHIKADIPLLIAGTGEDEAELRKIAGGDPRIRFLGFVDDAELLRLVRQRAGRAVRSQGRGFRLHHGRSHAQPQAGDRLQGFRRAGAAGEAWRVGIRRRSRSGGAGPRHEIR